MLLNKTDIVTEEASAAAFGEAAFPGALRISAKTGAGFDRLLEVITEQLFGRVERYRIPMEACQLVELVRKNGTILQEAWLEGTVELEARIPGTIDEDGKATTRTKSLLSKYRIQEE